MVLQSVVPAWDCDTPKLRFSAVSSLQISPLEGQIYKKEQMQLKVITRKSKDVCPEQVYVLAVWSRQAGQSCLHSH